MKIALCLSGQPRFVEKSYQNIKDNLMSGYDTDVFIHTWVDENNPYKFKDDGSNPRWDNRIQDPKTKQNITDWFRPKKALFETPKTFRPPTMAGIPVRQYFEEDFKTHSLHYLTEKGCKWFIEAIHSLWYSAMMSNLQKELYRMETGIDYDLVVRSRFDIMYRRKIVYEEFDPNTMYIASRVCTDHIHDFFSISGTKNMNAYCTMFPNLEYYMGLVPTPDWRCSEGALLQCMKHHGIKCQELGEIGTILRPGENV